MTEIRQMPGTPTTCRVSGDRIEMRVITDEGESASVTLDRSAGESLLRWLGVSRMPVSWDEVVVGATFGALAGVLVGVTTTFLLLMGHPL